MSNEITRTIDGRVHWTDDEVESYRGKVELLENGWIRIPETGNYYPPTEVVEVTVYGE